MKPNYLALRNLFGQSERFIVPLFQRPYVWTQEEQWEPLWDDIQTVAQRVRQTGKGEAIKGHFLGSVVLEQRSHATGGLPIREVIDGQQRLTTLQVCLHAASHAMTASAAASAKTGQEDAGRLAGLAARQVAALTRNTLVSEDEEAYKVWPTNDDRAAFREVMDATGPDSIAPTSTKLSDAYRFFYAAAEQYLKEDSDGRGAQALAAAVQDHLRLIVLDLEGTDEPQAIFETLNARGTPLLPADLVKNWLLWEAQRQQSDLVALYQAHWRPFDRDSAYWRKKIGTGHASRPRVDTFLANWLSERRTEPVSATHIYEQFLRHVSPAAGVRPPVGPLMAEIQSRSQLYRSIDQPAKAGDRFTVFLNRLQAMDIVALHPLLMHLLARAGSDAKDRNAIAEMLESYLVRRMVCGLNTRGYSTQFVKLIKPISEADPTSPAAPVVAQELTKAQDGSAVWPSDAKFEAEWLTRPLYGNLRRERLVMILRALEEALRAKKTKMEPTSVDFSTLQVEHVMPTSWQSHWPLPEGDRAELEAERSAHLNRIGNLTLVSSALNPTLSNAAWNHDNPKKSKRAALDEHSALLLNKALVKYESWDEVRIGKRARALFEVAIGIWPAPPA